MSLFPLKPTHAPVKTCNAALAQFEKHGFVTEGNPSVAFSNPSCDLYWYGVANLDCNGDMLISNAPAGSPIVINAYSSSEYSIYAHMQVFLNGILAGEWDTTGQPQDYTVYPAHYYSADHLGTTTLITNGQGALLNDSDYYPFGAENAVTTADPNHYKFTGYERDAESGFDYASARHFASAMGRFISPDPSGLAYADPTNPQSFNLYTYALNNPLKFTDPTGLYCAWDDGSSDSNPENGGANKSDCTDQGCHWTDDSNPCDKVTDGSACVATFDWNKPATDDAFLDEDLLGMGSGISFVPGDAPSVNGLTYSGCMLMAPGGRYTVSSSAIDSFQPGMANALTGAIGSLNAQGIVPNITSGFRTPAKQQQVRSDPATALRAAKGNSEHSVGQAADFRMGSNADAITSAMQANGLVSGAGFKHPMPEPWHFQSAPIGTSVSNAAVQRCGGGKN